MPDTEDRDVVVVGVLLLIIGLAFGYAFGALLHCPDVLDTIAREPTRIKWSGKVWVPEREE